MQAQRGQSHTHLMKRGAGPHYKALVLLNTVLAQEETYMSTTEKLPDLYGEGKPRAGFASVKPHSLENASQAGYTPSVSVPEFTGTATKFLKSTYNNAGTSWKNRELLAQPAHWFPKLVPHLV